MDTKEMGSFKKGFSGMKEHQEMADDAADVAVVVAPEPEEQAAPEESAMPDEAAAMSPEDAHKEAAWAGRLKKREAELKAREDALAQSTPDAIAEMPEEGAPEGDDMMIGDGMDEMTEAAAPLVDFSSAPENIQAIVAEVDGDFGDGFMAKFAAIAAWMAEQEADSKVGPVMQALTGFAESISRKEHYGSIRKAHEDYETVMASPEFAEYITSLDDIERETAEATIDHGTTTEVIKLFDAMKAWMQSKADDGDDAIDKAAMAAASGVRSNSYAPDMGGPSGDPLSDFRRGFNKKK